MIAVIVILAIVVLIILYAVVAYNGLVRLRNRVENAWAQIDVQLKQPRPHPEPRNRERDTPTRRPRSARSGVIRRQRRAGRATEADNA
jgi:hypothetical protein